jgi:hypothetical protein
MRECKDPRELSISPNNINNNNLIVVTTATIANNIISVTIYSNLFG